MAVRAPQGGAHRVHGDSEGLNHLEAPVMTRLFVGLRGT